MSMLRCSECGRDFPFESHEHICPMKTMNEVCQEALAASDVFPYDWSKEFEEAPSSDTTKEMQG